MIDKRFFESTRGQIVLLLRESDKTVSELASDLELSDNAVRAHLLTLERDRLVIQSGSSKGFRKPHFTYCLTAEAQDLFPKSYDSLFNLLLNVLKKHLSPSALKDMLFEVGHRIGVENAINGDLDQRLSKVLSTLETLGGAAKIIKEDRRILISSDSCPFGEAVAEHPDVCRVTESMIGEIVGKPVKEICDRDKMPKCCFEIRLS